MDIAASLAAAGTSAGSRPAVVDLLGDRVELGHATYANWVAKAANYLIEECELAPGSVVRILAVGPHAVPAWAAAVMAGAAWTAGCVLAAGQGTGDLLVLGEGEQEESGAGHRLRVGTGMAGRLEAPTTDPAFTEEVLACDDEVVDPPDLDGTDPALATDTGVYSHAQVLAAAGALASWLSLEPGARLVSALGLEAASGGWSIALLAPLVGGGTWIAAPGGPDAVDAAEHERAQAILLDGSGLDGPGPEGPAWADAPPSARLA